MQRRRVVRPHAPFISLRSIGALGDRPDRNEFMNEFQNGPNARYETWQVKNAGSFSSTFRVAKPHRYAPVEIIHTVGKKNLILPNTIEIKILINDYSFTWEKSFRQTVSGYRIYPRHSSSANAIPRRLFSFDIFARHHPPALSLTRPEKVYKRIH